MGLNFASDPFGKLGCFGAKGVASFTCCRPMNHLAFDDGHKRHFAKKKLHIGALDDTPRIVFKQCKYFIIRKVAQTFGCNLRKASRWWRESEDGGRKRMLTHQHTGKFLTGKGHSVSNQIKLELRRPYAGNIFWLGFKPRYDHDTTEVKCTDPKQASHFILKKLPCVLQPGYRRTATAHPTGFIWRQKLFIRNQPGLSPKLKLIACAATLAPSDFLNQQRGGPHQYGYAQRENGIQWLVHDSGPYSYQRINLPQQDSQVSERTQNRGKVGVQ